MPSLPAPMASQAQEAAESSGGFDALEPGVYTARLAKVTAGTAKSSSNPMWELEFDRIADLEGNKKPGRLWTNLVLIETVMWKVGQFFAAFNVPSTTNTDNLVGHRVRIQVDTRVITQGKRNGQMGNEINGFAPPKAGDEGYEQLVQLAARLGKAAPAKAAPAKAAPPAAAAAAPAAVAAPATPAMEAAPAAAAAVDPDDPWGSSADPNGGVEF